VTMVLFATVRANGAVWAPLIILCVGLLPVRFGFIFATDQWLGNADAIWWSFPVSSFANVALALAYYLQGGWKKARMMVEALPPEEGFEEALGTREPGGALKPAG
jgi:Na+-driven multidrug efflux pump